MISLGQHQHATHVEGVDILPSLMESWSNYSWCIQMDSEDTLFDDILQHYEGTYLVYLWRHMSRFRSILSNFIAEEKGVVTFGESKNFR